MKINKCNTYSYSLTKEIKITSKSSILHVMSLKLKKIIHGLKKKNKNTGQKPVCKVKCFS